MVEVAFWRGRSVLLTGHTGFKGSWLALWLERLGALTHGFALSPTTSPALFEVARVEQSLASSTIADIRSADAIAEAVARTAPEIVFHLAAQPLVGEAYRDPIRTYETNVMGTVHLLEAIRATPSVRAVVVVTSDKCYENPETGAPLREQDPLGGHDPYSSSKACAEIITSAWRRSYCGAAEAPRIATARAGNVIGGGDWAADRLVPNLIAAFSRGESAQLRRPDSVRPWQHVLEPLAGYLILAQALCQAHQAADRAWNFGPPPNDCIPVHELADKLASMWPGRARWEATPGCPAHEAALLQLDASAAMQELKWRPRWPLIEALNRTLAWHLAWRRSDDMLAFTRQQIEDYCSGSWPSFGSS